MSGTVASVLVAAGKSRGGYKRRTQNEGKPFHSYLLKRKLVRENHGQAIILYIESSPFRGTKILVKTYCNDKAVGIVS